MQRTRLSLFQWSAQKCRSLQCSAIHASRRRHIQNPHFSSEHPLATLFTPPAVEAKYLQAGCVREGRVAHDAMRAESGEATPDFFHAGSCAANIFSCQEASCGCRVMHPVGSRKLCKAMLMRSSLRCWKRMVLPLLSSSAQVFPSPAKCVTNCST